MPPYHINPTVNCDVDFSRDGLVGKTAVITGGQYGANGIGEAYVRALHHAGCIVFIGDQNANAGEKLSSELPGTRFVQGDVTNWDDQVRLFKEAAQSSPSGKIHYVIANAGITKKDQVFNFDGEITNHGVCLVAQTIDSDAGKEQEPQKPDLKIIDVNLKGTLYTSKLAMHYFISQNGTQVSNDQEDTCLIVISSGAGFLDVPRTPEYSSTKWAVRGIMHSLRRTAFYHGSRVNVISPWYIRTRILTTEAFDGVQKSGVEFARAEDAGECALRILSDTNINGRSFFVCARKWAARGYMDLNIEDYPERSLIQEIQEDQIRNAPVELGLLP